MATILTDVTMYRNTAQTYRNDAKRLIEAQAFGDAKNLFEAAVAEQQKAIRFLRRELNAVDENRDRGKKLELLRLLSQTYGSLGGTWRDAGRLEKVESEKKAVFEKAIKEYDAGYEIEQERKHSYDDDDSYNLLQRIVIRILHSPSCLDDKDQAVVRGLNVPDCLQAASKEIERQVIDEKTRTDSWAKADLVLVRALLGQPVTKALKDLETGNPDLSFYASTHTVIETLIEEGLGKNNRLGDLLREFQISLEQKGGISH